MDHTKVGLQMLSCILHKLILLTFTALYLSNLSTWDFFVKNLITYSVCKNRIQPVNKELFFKIPLKLKHSSYPTLKYTPIYASVVLAIQQYSNE